MPAVGADPAPRAVGPAGPEGGRARGLQVATAGALVAVVALLLALWSHEVVLAAEGGAPAGATRSGVGASMAEWPAALADEAAQARLPASLPASAAGEAPDPGRSGSHGSSPVASELSWLPPPRAPRLAHGPERAGGDDGGPGGDGEDPDRLPGTAGAVVLARLTTPDPPGWRGPVPAAMVPPGALGTLQPEPPPGELSDSVRRLVELAQQATSEEQRRVLWMWAVSTALAAGIPLTPGQSAELRSVEVEQRGGSGERGAGRDAGRTRSSAPLYVPPLTRPFPRKWFGDDETDPDGWHEFTERLFRRRPDGTREASFFTAQSLWFTLLSTGTGFYGNVLREDLPYALGNLPTVFARDVFGQIMVGRPIREDPYDNLVWSITLNSANVWLWEGIGYLGTLFLAPEHFDPIVERWRNRFISPPASPQARRFLRLLENAIAKEGYVDRHLSGMRGRVNHPWALRRLDRLGSMLVPRERLDHLLTYWQRRLAGPPTAAVQRSLDVLAFLRGKQVHSGIPLQIIGINIGAQLMINLLKPELPLPQPIAVDDNGQPRFATNLDYLANKAYDSILGIGLPTAIGTVFASTKIPTWAGKGRVALVIGGMSAGFKLFSDLMTDAHSLDEFNRLRNSPKAEVSELVLSGVLNHATWMTTAILDAVDRAMDPVLAVRRFWALHQARWAARSGSPAAQDRAEQAERAKELHWMLSRETWEKVNTSRARAAQAWQELVQLPTPKGVVGGVVQRLATQADTLLGLPGVRTSRAEPPAADPPGATDQRTRSDAPTAPAAREQVEPPLPESVPASLDAPRPADGPVRHRMELKPERASAAADRGPGGPPADAEAETTPARITLAAEGRGWRTVVLPEGMNAYEVQTADGPVHVLEDGRMGRFDETDGSFRLLDATDGGGTPVREEPPVRDDSHLGDASPADGERTSSLQGPPDAADGGGTDTTQETRAPDAGAPDGAG